MLYLQKKRNPVISSKLRVEIIGIFLSYNPFLGPIKFSGGLQPRGNYEKSLPKASRADEIVLIRHDTRTTYTKNVNI